ncbi:MAG: carbohydrate ABC transporter permease [Spirochaetaceae bacterium]|nr:MAG: carbohydrate ABC transporter permease [Spirochaetaceae bacterium]
MAARWKTKYTPLVLFLTAVLLVIMLFPFAVMLVTMIKPSFEIYATPRWWPINPTLHNLVAVWGEYRLAGFFTSSAIIAFGTLLANVLLCIPAAYAVARLRFPGRKFSLYFFLSIQMFSPVIVVISLFRIFVELGLINTYLAVILANTVFTMSFTIWMMTGYFRAIPLAIEECARVDGASRLTTITRIMLPIAAPGLVTAMTYTFIWSWNEFLFPLTLLRSQARFPITVGLYNFVGRFQTQWELLTAAAFFALLPILLLFFLIERRLVEGLAAGAVKS